MANNNKNKKLEKFLEFKKDVIFKEWKFLLEGMRKHDDQIYLLRNFFIVTFTGLVGYILYKIKSDPLCGNISCEMNEIFLLLPIGLIIFFALNEMIIKYWKWDHICRLSDINDLFKKISEKNPCIQENSFLNYQKEIGNFKISTVSGEVSEKLKAQDNYCLLKKHSFIKNFLNGLSNWNFIAFYGLVLGFYPFFLLLVCQNIQWLSITIFIFYIIWIGLSDVLGLAFWMHKNCKANGIFRVLMIVQSLIMCIFLISYFKYGFLFIVCVILVFLISAVIHWRFRTSLKEKEYHIKMLIELAKLLGEAEIKELVEEAFEHSGKKRKRGKKMNEKETYEILLRSVSPYYRAIGDPEKLKILLELRENYIDGMKWPQLKNQLNLSEDDLKNHIESLMEVGLVEKKINYRISKSGMGLLRQVDDTMKTMKEILEAKKESHS